MRIFHNEGRIAQSGWVWVFGSNVTGIHAAGEARMAKNNFGAVYGVSEGRMRDSYAIPVKSKNLQSLPIPTLQDNVARFFEHVKSCPRERFYITKVGCGTGEYKDELVAPLFMDAPPNCSFSADWKHHLERLACAV